MIRLSLIAIIFTTSVTAQEQSSDSELVRALRKVVVAQDIISQQHIEYVKKRIPKLTLPSTREAWSQEAQQLRKRVLDEVVFRGVPSSWRDGLPRIERVDTVQQSGYRIHKLRYEALPGLWIPALLYEPEKMNGKVPVVLNVNGHDRNGKAARYKQLRCINQAKRGMIALNVEWFGMGQLQQPGYTHNHLAKLDLCGTSGLSVFYLAMSRGIDVLLQQPHADARRVAVTGLSGGGWQTIIISSLDTRVSLTVPVAGYSALEQRLVHRSSIGDLEQNPNDLISITDYSHLTALMVPRPTLLVYNDKDNCCFVSKTVKPNTFDPVVPFFRQAGAEDLLEYHENSNPGTHNYDLDNRQQLYRFLGKHFLGGRADEKEIRSDDEVLSNDQLLIPLPEGSQTFDSLAAALADQLPQAWDAKPAQRRAKLREILRLHPQKVVRQTQVGREPVGDLTVTRWQFQTDDWTVPGVSIEPQSPQRVMLVVFDDGYARHANAIQKLATNGTKVVAIDPILIGSALPAGGLYPNAQLLATVGSRPLGIQSSQLAAVIRRVAETKTAHMPLSCHLHGPRSSLMGLCTAALAPKMELTWSYDQLPDTLRSYVRPSVTYNQSPETYCFGLLRWFDIAQLTQMTEH